MVSGFVAIGRYKTSLTDINLLLILICQMAALVRCAVVEVCTVPVLLVIVCCFRTVINVVSLLVNKGRSGIAKLLHICFRCQFGFLWSPYVIGRPYIFSCCGLFFLLLLLLFFPRLISAAGDWMFTILWHMGWP